MDLFRMFLNRSTNRLSVPTYHSTIGPHNNMIHLLSRLADIRFALVYPYAIALIFRILPSKPYSFFIGRYCPSIWKLGNCSVWNVPNFRQFALRWFRTKKGTDLFNMLFNSNLNKSVPFSAQPPSRNKVQKTTKIFLIYNTLES